MNSYTKGQISLEFYAALSAVLLLFLSSLLFVIQMRKAEEDKQIMLSSLLLAQQVANSADAMNRNLCGEKCSILLLLPNRISGISFPKKVEYNITFRSNQVIISADGYPSVAAAASISFDGLRISVERKEEGKLLRMEGEG